MNSLERVRAAINFEMPDRVPVIPQVFGHAATLAGVPLCDYVRNGELLARCQIHALRYYGYDAVFALMDVSVETEAAGSVLTYLRDNYPYVSSHALSESLVMERLAVPDPRSAGRMPELLKAAGILRREVGDDVLVVGCVLGPLTLTQQLLGADKALYLAIDQSELFSRLMDFAVEVIIRFGTAQIEAGVHLPLVFDPFASPAVIPPQFFREIELPYLQKVFSAFREAGAAANWLHIAGPAAPILEYYPQAGVDIANLDYCVDPSGARQTLPRTCLNGNIKPLSFVDSNPDAIAEESSALLDRFAGQGGFVLSSGCEIPPEAKPENVSAMVSAVHGK